MTVMRLVRVLVLLRRRASSRIAVLWACRLWTSDYIRLCFLILRLVAGLLSRMMLGEFMSVYVRVA